jgi:hypothetical protein
LTCLLKTLLGAKITSMTIYNISQVGHVLNELVLNLYRVWSYYNTCDLTSNGMRQTPTWWLYHSTIIYWHSKKLYTNNLIRIFESLEDNKTYVKTNLKALQTNYSQPLWISSHVFCNWETSEGIGTTCNLHMIVSMINRLWCVVSLTIWNSTRS